MFGPTGAAALYRRDWLVRLGGFDESFFCYFEDVDLNLRLQVAGGRCLYVPAARVRHVGGASTGGLSTFTIYHSQRNLVWTYVKSMPPHLFWRYLPMHVLLNVGSIVSYGVRGHTKTAVACQARCAPGAARRSCAPAGSVMASRAFDQADVRRRHAPRQPARSWARRAPRLRFGAPRRERGDLVARDEAEREDEAGEHRDRHDRSDDLAELCAEQPRASATPPLATILSTEPSDGLTSSQRRTKYTSANAPIASVASVTPADALYE